MLIVCPSCATSYVVDLASLPPQGRQVRCVRCRTIWRAEPSRADKLRAAAAALASSGDTAGEIAVASSAVSAPAAELAAVTAGRPPGSETTDAPEHALGGDEAPVATVADHDTAPAADAVPPPAGDASADLEAPPLAPVDLDAGFPPIDVAAQAVAEHDSAAPAHEAAENIETAAAQWRRRKAKRRSTGWPLSRLQTATLALVLIDAIVIGWRSDLVRALPQTGSFYAMLGLSVNLRGLTFENVATAEEQQDNVPVLVIEGDIVNRTHKVEEVPRLKFIVRNAAQQEIYSWTAVPSHNALSAGEAIKFRGRLASPPPEARDLVVRFVSRSDVADRDR